MLRAGRLLPLRAAESYIAVAVARHPLYYIRIRTSSVLCAVCVLWSPRRASGARAAERASCERLLSLNRSRSSWVLRLARLFLCGRDVDREWSGPAERTLACLSQIPSDKNGESPLDLEEGNVAAGVGPRPSHAGHEAVHTHAGDFSRPVCQLCLPSVRRGSDCACRRTW